MKKLRRELKEEGVPKKKREKILKEVMDRREKERTMSLSIKEGSLSSVSISLSNAYMIPYALALNASNFQIGLLRSFIGLFSPLSQLFSSKLMKKFSRKKVVVTNVVLEALMFIPILLLGLFFWKGMFVKYLPGLLIIFYTLLGIFGGLALPAWFSLMGDIVPEKIRGKYFGKRNKIAGAAGLIATLFASFLLDYFKTDGKVLFGFLILFSIATVARLLASFQLNRYYDPDLEKDRKGKLSFFKFLKNIKSNFTKFSYYVSFMNLAVMIASPFFSVYMLKELGFSYITFMIINLSATLSSLVFYPIWGKFSDVYGRRETLLLSSIFISIMPVMWVFSTSPYFLVFPMLLVGVGWAGFRLASSTFIYDSLESGDRSKGIAYRNILTGGGVFIGSVLGGGMLHLMPLLNIKLNHFFIIFFISAILRGVFSMVFLPFIKEVKKVRKFYAGKYLREIVSPTISPAMQELHIIEKKIRVDEKRVKDKIKRLVN